jgi:hypothetical protein
MCKDNKKNTIIFLSKIQRVTDKMMLICIIRPKDINIVREVPLPKKDKDECFYYCQRDQ